MANTTDNEEGVILADEFTAKLYPNPNNGEFVIEFNLNEIPEASLQILDIRGRLLLTQSIINTGNLIRIDNTNFENGIYFININVNSKNLWVSKYIINK